MFGKDCEQGITVIELVITVSLISVLLIPFFALLHTTVNYYHVTEAGIFQQQNLRIAMEAIVRDLRQCEKLVDREGNVKLDKHNLLLRNRKQETIWYYLRGKDLRWAVKGKGDFLFYGHNPVAGGITELEFNFNKEPPADSTLVTVRIKGEDRLGSIYELISVVLIRMD